MVDYMEEHLDMPMSTLLALIQSGIINQTTYFGIRTFKSPMDAWVYQEIICETKPDVIIEIGNANGGSTLHLAHLCDLLDNGRVIGIDLSHDNVPAHVKAHPRISLITGDACGVIEKVAEMISAQESVLIIEDSSHTYDNTLKVLRLYSRLIKPGDYFIVEDSIGQHGLSGGRFPGPYEAIETFSGENSDFEIDRSREHFFITWNPKGYLRRKNLSDEPSDTRKPVSDFGGFNVSRLKMREIVRLLVPPILIQIVEKVNNWRMISAGPCD